MNAPKKRIDVKGFRVVLEPDEDGRIVAVCPALQGCYTDGETEAEAAQNIKSAIRLHVEDRIANGEPITVEDTPD